MKKETGTCGYGNDLTGRVVLIYENGGVRCQPDTCGNGSGYEDLIDVNDELGSPDGSGTGLDMVYAADGRGYQNTEMFQDTAHLTTRRSGSPFDLRELAEDGPAEALLAEEDDYE